MKILYWPHSTLQAASAPLLEPPDDLFLSSMFKLMEAHTGVGLSAIQVGHRLRLFVTNVDGIHRVFINTEWDPAPSTKPTWVAEGCLSVPGYWEQVPRFWNIEASFYDEKMEHHTETFSGLMAQVIQHETEHAEGHIFLDHLSTADRSRIRGEMAKRKRSGQLT